MAWVKGKAANGRHMLLNTEMTFAIIEDEKGDAHAISIAGTQQPMGDKFSDVEAYLEELDADETDDEVAGAG